MQLLRWSLPILLLLLSTGFVSADNTAVEKIAQEFKPVSGVIIMPVNGDFLIDLDASKGVAEGDLFSVVVPGERVVHPVTGEVLGTLDTVKGLLEVTRVKGGYSYARPIGENKGLEKGDQIRRFENIKAAFWDYDGSGEALFADLRDSLPALEWQGYAAAQAQRPPQPKPLPGGEPPMVFIYRNGQLEVRGAMFQVLASFPVGAEVAAAPAPVPASKVAVPVPQPVPTLQPKAVVPVPVPAAGIQKTPKRTSSAIVQQEQPQTSDVWTGFKWDDNPLGVEVADFDGDGSQEIAVLFKKRLEIDRIKDGSRQQLFTLPLGKIDKTLTISSADLDGTGKPELFISAVNGKKVASLVVAEQGGGYQVVQQGMNWFLRAMQLPDGGKVVLGQKLGDALHLYDTEVHRIEWNGREYAAAGLFSRPWQTSIFSLQAFSDAQGELRFAEISDNDRLRVFSADARVLWESSRAYGGRTAFFPQNDYTGGADYATKDIYISPRQHLMADGTLMAPLNEGARFSSSFNSLGPCEVVALRWDGSVMVEQWHTKPQEGTMVDFVMADVDNDGQQEVALLVLYARAGVLSKGKAGLRVFEF